MSNEQLREALQRIQYKAVSLADAQVIALEALASQTTSPAAAPAPTCKDSLKVAPAPAVPDTDELESALERLIERCNTDQFLCNDDAVIHAEATLERVYKSRKSTSTPAAPSQPVTDEVFAALELDPEAFRTEGGAVNAGKLKAAILHPYNYLPPDHWLQARFSKPGGRPLATDQATLTDEEIDKIADEYEDPCGRIRVDQVFPFSRAIIAALREKEALR